MLSEIGDNLSNMLNPNDLSNVSSPVNNNNNVRKAKSSEGTYGEKKRTMAISLNKLAEQIEEKGNKRYDENQQENLDRLID